MGLSASKSKVCFFFPGVSVSLRNRSALKQFITGIFKTEGKRLEWINYIFCTDEALLAINRSYLRHDYYTDIITFDLSAGAGTEAEVYISIDRVRDNAKSLGISFQQELHRVIFHGALHLCGYGDKKPADKAQMRAREDHYLRKYLK